MDQLGRIDFRGIWLGFGLFSALLFLICAALTPLYSTEAHLTIFRMMYPGFTWFSWGMIAYATLLSFIYGALSAWVLVKLMIWSSGKGAG